MKDTTKGNLGGMLFVLLFGSLFFCYMSSFIMILIWIAAPSPSFGEIGSDQRFEIKVDFKVEHGRKN